MGIKKAVIPAAGMGTRFLPISKGVPKEMLNIVDKPSIQYIAEEAMESGIQEILIIISKGKESIQRYFTRGNEYKTKPAQELIKGLEELLSKVKISFVEQKNLNGSGGAVLLAKEFAKGEDFAVLFGDDVTFSPNKSVTKQLINAYEETGKCCILGCQEIESKEAIKYGVVKKIDSCGRLTKVEKLIEKPSLDELPSNLCSLGRYILPNRIFDILESTPTFKGEIYLSVAIDLLIGEQNVYAYNFEGQRYDLGDKLGFAKANIEYGVRSKYGDSLKNYLKDFVNGL